MPLPLILGIAAGVAGTVGVGSGIHGAVKMKDANDTMKLAQNLHKENIDYFTTQNEIAIKDMDALGKKELEVLESFQRYSYIFEKIHNKPEFDSYINENVKISNCNMKEIKDVSIGAGMLLGGIGSAAVGTAGGFAAAGATTAAVMAFGTASTGTAIASLTGVAATNATLAALGGGALAAGGGGMALGTAVLGASTVGVGLMIGGIIFNVVGGSLSNKADEAYNQVRKEREEINEICEYLSQLSETAKKYMASISRVYEVYQEQVNVLGYIVNNLNKEKWEEFTEKERMVAKNTVLLVNLLYQMAKVQIVLEESDDSKINVINKKEIKQNMWNAETVLFDIKIGRKEDGNEDSSEANGDNIEAEKFDWDKIKQSISFSVPDRIYYRWIDFLNAEVSGSMIKIIAPYREAAEFIKKNYSETIESAIEEQMGKRVKVAYGFKKK